MHESKSPVRLARDLLQVIQETVFARKFEEFPKKCPLVKEESDLSSSEEEGETRLANLIDFFFTIVRSQKEERKNSGGSCFKSETSPDDKIQPYTRVNTVNTELEQKMETLIEFLANGGCIDKEDSSKDDKKITLMEFLFGADDKTRPIIEISPVNKGFSLLASNINVKDLSYIDETPVEETNETLEEMLMKYMDNYGLKDRGRINTMSVTPSLSEKSKSDVTISKLETFSDMSKTKSDSTLTQTQDTVIDRYDDMRSDKSRRISETVIDLSCVKQDLEEVFDEAISKICQLRGIALENDTMTEEEDTENFKAYTRPDFPQYPYSVELSDIQEEDEPSSRDIDRNMSYIRQAADEILRYIDDKLQEQFLGESSSDEINFGSLKRASISLIDLRNIPDLPPSMMIKPKVVRVDKSTSTADMTQSLSDLSKRIDSACNTEDTSLSSDGSERALDKLQSLHKFFSISRLEIIDESLEDNGHNIKSPKQNKVEQASLDDVEDLQDDFDMKINDFMKIMNNDETVESNQGDDQGDVNSHKCDGQQLEEEICET